MVVTAEDKLVRIRNILNLLERMEKSPTYQKHPGVDELRRRALIKIREVVS